MVNGDVGQANSEEIGLASYIGKNGQENYVVEYGMTIMPEYPQGSDEPSDPTPTLGPLKIIGKVRGFLGAEYKGNDPDIVQICSEGNRQFVRIEEVPVKSQDDVLDQLKENYARHQFFQRVAPN